jgi:hypothetical protein
MRWFRSHLGFGSRLALFALAVQLVLSFGHVHLDKSLGSSAPVRVAVQAASHHGGPSPAGHVDADDYCAICATVSLVATSVLPEQARLPLPVTLAADWPRDFATIVASLDAEFFFQARAPPAIA